MPRSHDVAAIAGDGVGPEVIAEGKKVLEAAGERFGFDIRWKDLDIGAERYLRTGEFLTESDLSALGRCRTIYFGAIGDERVKPGVLEKGILLSLRFHFDQYVNLRPVKLLPGVWTPLAGKGPADIDFVVVRENTEDFYVGIGSRFRGKEKRALEVIRSLYQVKFGVDAESDAEEVAYQIGVITREGARRVIRFAFDIARRRGRTSPKVTSVDKANVLTDIYGLWREVFSEVAEGISRISSEFSFVDAITMWFVKNPESFDVVVSPNMFGDIITDLGAMIQGGLGLAPGGNINPEGTSMFEPIHGSAPQVQRSRDCEPGCNHLGGIHAPRSLGEHEAAAAVLDGIGRAITAGVKTRDMGGQARTPDVGDFIAAFLRNP